MSTPHSTPMEDYSKANVLDLCIPQMLEHLSAQGVMLLDKAGKSHEPTNCFFNIVGVNSDHVFYHLYSYDHSELILEDSLCLKSSLQINTSTNSPNESDST